MPLPAAVDEIRETAIRANDLLRQIATVRRNKARAEALLEEQIQELKDREGPAIETLKQEEESIVRQLVELIMPKFDQLAVSGTQMIRLRNGEIRKHRGHESLEVSDDEEIIIRRIARKGGLTKYTRVGKRTLDRTALKKAPAFVAKIKGLKVVRNPALILSLPQEQGEVIQTNDTLSIPLPHTD